MERFTGNAKKFIEDFFKAGGTHPNSESTAAYFANAFVDPPHFEKICTLLRPVDGAPRVVFIDGHPRSGKTWAVVGAIAHFLQAESEQFGMGSCWSAGQDCLKVPKIKRMDLATAVQRMEVLLSEVPDRKQLRVVLIDDILGTHRPRQFRDREKVAPYFTYEAKTNPWLKRLPEGCTLVITNRSMFFMLLEVFLGDPSVRGLASGQGGLTRSFQTYRWGIFRTFADGELTGAFNRETLEDVAKRTYEYHPFAELESTPELRLSQIRSTPLLAFVPGVDSARKVKPENLNLTKAVKSEAACVLFGHDLITLSRQVRELRKNQSVRKEWAENAFEDLQKAYLLALAPGFLFLTPGTYDALGIGQERGEHFLRSLYFSDKNFASGRLPNEFYMLALDHHLCVCTDDVLEAALGVLGGPNETGRCQFGAGMVLRGLLERARCNRNEPLWDALNRSRKFDDLYESYQRRQADFLLQLEKQGDCKAKSTHFNPGLAASVGWAVYRLFTKEEIANVQASVDTWFEECVKELVSELPQAGINDSGWDVAWDSVAAAYSTFLQWAIKGSKTRGIEPVRKVAALLSTYKREVALRLGMIFEDELLWGILEKGYDLTDLAESVRSALEGTSSPTIAADDTRFQMANRFLTLAWHNSWMDGEEPVKKKKPPEPAVEVNSTRLLDKATWKRFATLASNWIQYHEKDMLEVIRKQPELLDVNLQYHWCHFLTQRALWMRDWCLVEDPGKYERQWSQIAPGSIRIEDNRYLALIAMAVIEEASPRPKTVRNLLLLIGTRCDNFPLFNESDRHCQFKQVFGAVDSLLTKAGEYRGQLLKYVLQAIFELARQGFLDPWRKGTPLLLWCMQTLDQAGESEVESAWRDYLIGLRAVTHPLDLLPPEADGWKDIKRELAAGVP